MLKHYLPKPWNHWLPMHRFAYYQIVYWICYVGLTFANNSLMPNPFRWWEVLITIAFIMAIVYSIVYVFLRGLKPAAKTAAVLIGMFIGYALLYYLVAFVWGRSFGERIVKVGDRLTIGGYLFTMLIHWYHSMLDAGLLAAIYRVRKVEGQKRELLEKNHQTHVQFLTAQIDPHEQANLLNIPYQLAVSTGNMDMAEVLLHVKQRLLYVPEKAKDISSEVPLGAEMEQCDRIIWLNSKRFPKCFVTIDVPEVLHHWVVPVFSVSAFLQNAFKYGVSWDEHVPISLRARQEDNRLTIRLRNKINPHKADETSSGIGNDNIRQRLALLYDGRAGLETCHTPDGWYEAILTFTKS
ncbi:sensor histidine kinase [Parapedobacter koreensis]|uniref:Histidine kinase n=1 Tax=Parapedobacter koreensis TaxID=332977 RepID=A0A1H7NM90_9SPHI|nr:hypothetical protein [Parapedobacter koreensis]SEL24088.1 hypothetical protein SAMN05421740_10423 [Parapedobacter koreensis]